ncbi:tRNA (guanosine(37)-N1)-methyltransferase TrmD [Candidatus Saccharibacteria bacterium]|nr:tRNA (guanosine(37)-N1)-methyltransferase TrmD [Candidatus Saccharibacteria bacterium]
MEKAARRGLAEFEFVDLREFGLGPHKSVDDTPYGGGDGMLLRCEPVFAAIETVKEKDPDAKVILPTPVGETWNQRLVESFVFRSVARPAGPSPRAAGATTRAAALRTPLRQNTNDHYIILCPHYEGYDERILSIVDYKISLGKYVLTGGELPALIIIDSIVRLIPGVLGGETSAEIESFSDGNNLEYPQYTKPAEFRGMKVPEILLSGNHGEIAKWRAEHSGKAE